MNDFLNELCIPNTILELIADKAYEMVQEMCSIKGGELCAFALVEDGMFAENILQPVALEAEMLWSPETDLKALMREVALREYVTFA